MDDVLALVAGALVLIAFYRKTTNPYHRLYFERPQLSIHGKLVKSSAPMNIAEKLEQIGAHLLIIWGSQSGTAESYAVKLGAEIQQRFTLKSLVVDISDYNPATLLLVPPSIPFIILASTYGEGDPTDNCVQFVEWLQALDTLVLQNHPYAILGFGNSNYKLYNRVANVIDKSLQSFGATRMIQFRRVDAASDESTETFLEWKIDLFYTLKDRLSLKEHIASYEPQFNITKAQDVDAKEIPSTLRQGHLLQGISVVGSRQIMTSEGQCCLHFQFDLSQHSKLTYRTGDHLLLWASNPTEEVDLLLSVCGLPGNDLPIHVRSIDDSSTGFPAVTTAYELLQHHVEICAPITRDIVARLAEFAPSEEDRKLLENFGASKEQFARLGRVKLRDVLSLTRDHQWKIPLEFLLEVLPRMKPRYYSLSSSSIEQPKQASITVSVQDPPTGVATGYLLQLHKQMNNITRETSVASKLIAGIKSSPFKLPIANSIPIILIAAGTGLAPFRAFIRERAVIHGMGKISGKITLFFGCRRQEDFIYFEELTTLQEVLGDQLVMHSAFSRSGPRKTYVQDKVEEHVGEIYRSLMEEHAALYICGSAVMARSVGEVIGSYAMKNGQLGLDEWIQVKDRKRKQRKWQEDVW